MNKEKVKEAKNVVAPMVYFGIVILLIVAMLVVYLSSMYMYNYSQTCINIQKEELEKYMIDAEAKAKAEAETKEEYDQKIVPAEGESLLIEANQSYYCEYAYIKGDLVIFKPLESTSIYYRSLSELKISLIKNE